MARESVLVEDDLPSFTFPRTLLKSFSVRFTAFFCHFVVYGFTLSTRGAAKGYSTARGYAFTISAMKTKSSVPAELSTP